MQRQKMGWRITLPLGVLMLSLLACGGFQLRTTSPTPTPTKGTAQPTAVAAVAKVATPSATAVPPTVTTVPPTATPDAAPVLTVGKSARVAAGPLNVRAEPKATAQKTGSLDTGAVVTLKSGPSEADGYRWWQIDNGSGLAGWVAAGPPESPWLVPAALAAAPAASGGKKLVIRAVRLGDQVQVTTLDSKLLTLRENASKDATAVARVMAGTQFTVKAGPIKQDGYNWWQIQGDQVSGWAAEGDDQDRWLTPTE